MKSHAQLIHRLITVFLTLSSFLISIDSKSQSFYKEKDPKTFFYQIGLGAGTFFSAPRPSYDSIVNEIKPVIYLGIGKKIGNHFSMKTNFSFQPFSSKGFVLEEGGNESYEPIFNGFNYAFDINPTLNLFPGYHHMSRPIVDLQLGVGIGYLITYRTEKFYFNEKYFEFNLFENSFYIPIRASTVFKIGRVSDLAIEGSFFYTCLDNNRKGFEMKKDSDHFGQITLIYRKYFKTLKKVRTF